MGSVAISPHVTVRDQFGRFYRDIEDAGRRTVERLVEEGADASRALAPVRTGALKASIKPYMVSRTQGFWGSGLKYALPQETGSRPHDLPAHVTFYWEKAGRMWMYPEVYQAVTGFPGADPIKHPGNPAVHYLLHGYERTWPRVYSIMREEYP